MKYSRRFYLLLSLAIFLFAGILIAFWFLPVIPVFNVQVLSGGSLTNQTTTIFFTGQHGFEVMLFNLGGGH